MSHYFVGDVPATQLVIEIDQPDIDLSGFNAVTGVLTNPVGAPVALTGAVFTLDDEDGTVSVSWGTVSRFATRGLYTLTLTATGAGTLRQVLGSVRIVVEQENGWHTLATARAEWRDAPDDDAVLFTLLDSAHTACIQYAPAREDGTPVPLNFRQAQLVQTRDIWNAIKVNPDGQIGFDGMPRSVFPMSWHVKALLRPKTWPPVIR